MIRAATEADIGPVVDLFQRTFKDGDGHADAAQREYFQRLYFENPWQDENRPSLVSTSPDGRISGFLGVVPMPLRRRNRAVRASIGGNFMVDPDLADALTAVRILRTFLHGDHDLAFTDTANDTAARMWRAAGGELCQVHSMRWVVPLQLASFGLSLARRSRRLGVPVRVLLPVGRSIDSMLDARRRRRHDSSPESTVHVVDSAFVHDFVTDHADRNLLRLDDTHQGFDWLYDMCRRKQQFGELRTLAFRRGEQTIGVVMYYPNSGDTAQLVLLASTPGQHSTVLRALLGDARANGSAALMGRADANLTLELERWQAVYLSRNDFVVLYASDPSLVNEIRTGDVQLSRLTGEWWTRMNGDTWDP